MSRFAQRIYREGAPEAIERKVIELVVDQIGLQVACATLPWSKSVFEYIHDNYRLPAGQDRHNSATVCYYGLRTRPEQAAFANAAFGHGQDFDDTCQLVQTHGGAVVIPVAIAVGESVGASGRQILRAATAGLEIMLRTAHAVSPGCLRRGHHTPPAAGPFGAAAAAGLLLGLDEDRLCQALTVAGSFTGGLTEYTQSGGSVKRIHTAIPAAAGIRAAELARRGMTGPPTVFEGRKGFVRVYTDTPSPERLTTELHTRFLIQEVGLKAYNCCYFIHAPIDALTALIAGHQLKPDEIASIEVGTSRHGVTHVGSIPEPTDAVGGQFSMHFTLALVATGHLPGLASYTGDRLTSPRLRDIASRVRVYADEVAEAEYPSNWGCVLTVTTVTGEVFTRRVRHPLGTPENPMSAEQHRQKFYSNVMAALPPGKAAKAYDTLLGLPEVTAIRSVVAELVPDWRGTPGTPDDAGEDNEHIILSVN